MMEIKIHKHNFIKKKKYIDNQHNETILLQIFHQVVQFKSKENKIKPIQLTI